MGGLGRAPRQGGLRRRDRRPPRPRPDAGRGRGGRARGERRSVRPSGATLGGAVLALGENEFESGARTDARAEEIRRRGTAVVRYRCAVFSLASAALGRLDGYVEHGCRIWDVAAGAILCREAGLAVAVAPLGDGRVAIEAIAPALAAT